MCQTEIVNLLKESRARISPQYTGLDRPIGLVVECSPMARKSGVQSLVESYQRLKKRYLIPPCLTFIIISYISRVKWSNTGKGVAPSHKPRYSSYWKGSFRIALDFSHQHFIQDSWICRYGLQVRNSRLNLKYECCSKVSKLYPDFRFFTHLSPLYGSHIHRN